jgi:hypothetical protein
MIVACVCGERTVGYAEGSGHRLESRLIGTLLKSRHNALGDRVSTGSVRRDVGLFPRYQGDGFSSLSVVGQRRNASGWLRPR